MAFGIGRNPMPRLPGASMRPPRPALGMPGLKAGSLPGLQRGATIPRLTGGSPCGGYGDLVRLNVLKGLKGPAVPK